MEGVLCSNGGLNMQLSDFLTEAPDGEIRLTGHRIGLFHVVEHYNDGDSAEMLASRYPTLPLALVHKVIAFYLDNQEEVDAYITGCGTAMSDQQHAANKLDVTALRLRLAS